MLKQEFTTSYLTFYLKASVALEGDFVKVSNPNTILKLIPLGSNNKTIAVPQISSVSNNFRLDFKTLIWGIIITLVGYNMLSEGLLGLLFLGYGILTVLGAFETVLQIHNTSGQIVELSVIVFEKEKLLSCQETIEQLISRRHDDTNVAKHSAINADKIVAAINNK